MFRKYAGVITLVLAVMLLTAAAAPAAGPARKATGTFTVWDDTTVSLSVHGEAGVPGEPGYRPARGYLSFTYGDTTDTFTVKEAWFSASSCSFTVWEDEYVTFTVDDSGAPGLWEYPDSISAVFDYPEFPMGWAVIIDSGNLTVH